MAVKFPLPLLRGSEEAITYPAFVEYKIDGEFNWLYVEDGQGYLKNKYTKIRPLESLNKLVEIPSVLSGSKIKEIVLLGELFYGMGKAGDLYKFLSHKNDPDLSYKVFDIALAKDESGKVLISADDPIESRKEFLLELFLKSTTMHIPLKSYLVNYEEEQKAIYDKAIEAGFEGVVVKPLGTKLLDGSCSYVKIKNKDRVTALVVNIDPVLERMDVEFNDVAIGVKLVNKDKARIKVGDLVVIEHQGILPSGSLRHPVFIRKGEEHDAENTKS